MRSLLETCLPIMMEGRDVQARQQVMRQMADAVASPPPTGRTRPESPPTIAGAHAPWLGVTGVAERYHHCAHQCRSKATLAACQCRPER